MATSIIPYGGDPSWTLVPLGANSSVKYRERNGVVTILGFVQGDITVGNTAVLLATLPAKYRPTEPIYFPISHIAANTGDGFGVIQGDRVYARNTFTNMAYFIFNVSYIAG